MRVVVLFYARLLAKIKISEPKRSCSTPPALTKASRRVLTMASNMLAKIKGTIALTGVRAFFVLAGWNQH